MTSGNNDNVMGRRLEMFGNKIKGLGNPVDLAMQLIKNVSQQG